MAGLLLAVLILSPPMSASGSVPTWSAGDYWQWESAQGSYGGAGPAQTTMTVVGEESAIVAGVSYSAYHVKVWINLTNGGPTSNSTGDAWFRIGDLSEVMSVIKYNVSGSSARSTGTTTYAPPLPMHFPLVANDSWQATTSVTSMGTSSGQATTWCNATWTAIFRVGSSLEVTVFAGTFSTMPVTETVTINSSCTGGQFTQVDYWSAEVGNYVEDSQQQLISYRYTPSGTPGTPPGPGSTILGLPPLGWVAIALIAAVAVSLDLLLRGRRPRAPPRSDSSPPSRPPDQ